MIYKVKELKKTCNGWPTQWEGKLDNGKMVYIRYRWGRLSVSMSKNSTNNIDDVVVGEFIYEKYVGEKYDGVMENNKMLLTLKNVIEFDIKKIK